MKILIWILTRNCTTLHPPKPTPIAYINAIKIYLLNMKRFIRVCNVFSVDYRFVDCIDSALCPISPMGLKSNENCRNGACEWRISIECLCTVVIYSYIYMWEVKIYPNPPLSRGYGEIIHKGLSDTLDTTKS